MVKSRASRVLGLMLQTGTLHKKIMATKKTSKIRNCCKTIPAKAIFLPCCSANMLCLLSVIVAPTNCYAYALHILLSFALSIQKIYLHEIKQDKP